MRIPKRTADMVRNIVAELLVDNPGYTARELKEKVERTLQNKYQFTERTYLNIKKKLVDENSGNPKDIRWSLGCSVEYNIPADAIPKIIKVNQRINSPGFLTVRTAQWIAKFSELITDLDALYRISSLYCKYENIFRIANIDFITTKPDMMLPDPEKVQEAFEELLSKGG